MEVVHVKNLDKYHPGYKDRELIWCKVYFKMLNADPAFEMLCEIDKWRLIAFIMLELQIKKPVPIDTKYLLRKDFDLKKRPISLTLQMLQHFISPVTQDEKPCSVDKSREEKSREEKRERRFTPPSVSEVSQYVKEIGCSVDPQAFVDFYASKGWMVGSNKMKDWKAAVRTWRGRQVEPAAAKLKLFPIQGKTCGKAGCPLPAVYKDSTGAYDHFYCTEHMPAEVKAKYE